MASKNQDISPSHSDSDDWTLVSPPHSASNSPNRENLSCNESSSSERSSSNSSLDQYEDEDEMDHNGLIDIDLFEFTRPRKKKVRIAPCEERSSSAELAEQGFQPLDTTTDDDEYENDDDEDDDEEDDDEEGEEVGGEESRRSSLTQSELGEYVDLGEDGIYRTNSYRANVNNKSSATLVQQTSIRNQLGIIDDQPPCLLLLKTKLDELSDAASTRRRDTRLPRFYRSSPLSSTSNIWRVPIRHWILLNLFLLMMYIIMNYILVTSRQSDYHDHHTQKSDKISPHSLNMNLIENLDKNIPTSQQYLQLRSLNNELNECIKRQSPTSYKYYISEDRFKDSTFKRSKGFKPYRSLVCYGQEVQWRKRFDLLKSEYQLDLRTLILDTKKRITNEALKDYFPALQYELVLNQIEYLDFIENKRKEKHSEDLIKYLQAQNQQLLRKLNQPDEAGYRKAIVNLELKNSKLQRENGMLKENLGQKAGPTYIKQSLELEQYERENTILKQFHYQVSQDISKSLKLFNLHTIDASTILDDQESLNSQLMLTRGYLRRLREKISTILIENEGLKEELKEVYLLSVTNKANLPATSGGVYNGRQNTYSNALATENCTKTFKELQKSNDLMREEIERLRQNCSGNYEIEKCSGRHLNRTKETPYHDNGSNIDWKQLSSLDTALDKHTKDALSLHAHNEAIVEELMTLLTKFNHQIESNGLAVIDQSLKYDAQQGNVGLLSSDKLTSETKVIPNYIREAVRTDRKCNRYSDALRRKATLTPPPVFAHSSSNNSATTSDPDTSDNNQDNTSATATATATTTIDTRHNISLKPVDENSDDVYEATVPNYYSKIVKRAEQRKQLRKQQMKVMVDSVMQRRQSRKEQMKIMADSALKRKKEYDAELLEMAAQIVARKRARDGRRMKYFRDEL